MFVTENNTGNITCSEFTKSFLALGFSERDKEMRSQLEKQRKLEEQRKQDHERKTNEMATKNLLKVSYEFSEEDMESALEKLRDAAWRFDKNMAGAPNLDAFESQEMEPHIFKEQLKRAFNLKV